ncbi:MAG: DUF4340 domain-containing protein [Ignavibacteria bacterium]|nr:DUF4340 domain-containing protein [Ignavibacteria bacterium]MBI3765600.1 DUF4340 domain-containing protein [Ignavibacteriales bacterium]
MNRSTLILIGLLLVLGAITLFLLPSEKEREASYKPDQVSVRVDSGSVAKFEITRSAKTIAIENVGGRWTITAPIHYVADPMAVAQVLKGISKFKVGSLISSNPEKQGLFQVDSSGTAFVVTDREGKTVSMIIGKMGPSFSEVYFRVLGSKDVYLGEGLDSWLITKDVKEWRDKTILTTTSESIKELSYSVGNKDYHFRHDTTGWKSGDKTIESSVMNPILNSLSNLRADDFVDTAAKIESYPIVLSIKGQDQTSLNLYPMLPDSSKYFVSISTSPQMFVLNKWTAQQLLKPIEKPAEPGKPAPLVAETPRKEIAKAPPQVAPKEHVETKNQIPPPISRKEETKTPSPSPVSVEKKEKKQDVVNKDASPQKKTEEPIVTKEQQRTPTIVPPPSGNKQPEIRDQSGGSEDEGELIVHTVKKGETMLSISEQYHVSIPQIKKWNLLKSGAVKPGQELYIYVKK